MSVARCIGAPENSCVYVIMGRRILKHLSSHWALYIPAQRAHKGQGVLMARLGAEIDHQTTNKMGEGARSYRQPRPRDGRALESLAGHA